MNRELRDEIVDGAIGIGLNVLCILFVLAGLAGISLLVYAAVGR